MPLVFIERHILYFIPAKRLTLTTEIFLPFLANEIFAKIGYISLTR